MIKENKYSVKSGKQTKIVTANSINSASFKARSLFPNSRVIILQRISSPKGREYKPYWIINK